MSHIFELIIDIKFLKMQLLCLERQQILVEKKYKMGKTTAYQP